MSELLDHLRGVSDAYAAHTEEWDADACYKPFAIYDPDARSWLLWYNGRRGGVEQIGLATHEGEGLGFKSK